MVPEIDLESKVHNLFLEQNLDLELEAFIRSGLYEFVDSNYNTWKCGVYKRIREGKVDIMNIIIETIENDTPKDKGKNIYDTLKGLNNGLFALAVDVRYFDIIKLMDDKRKDTMLTVVAQCFIGEYLGKEKPERTEYIDEEDLEAYN